MHSHSNAFPRELNRFSPKKVIKPVAFTCLAPQAERVSLMGDFNDWDPESHPMRRQPDGAWRLEVQLNHGHHHYLFSIDGKPTLDSRAHGTARDHKGEKVSLVAVS